MDEEMVKSQIVAVATANLDTAQRIVAQVAIELLDDVVDDRLAEGDYVCLDREAWEDLKEAAKAWRDASEAFRRAVAATIPREEQIGRDFLAMRAVALADKDPKR
jgi:hypothetical protein